ncbi:MAG: hypothetical protein Q7R46_00220 [bacterium]|nr:hypothetical protein [bacterium]
MIKHFLRKNLGKRIPLLRSFYYAILSPILVAIKSPIKIWGGNVLHLPLNGIDYIPEIYEPETIAFLEKTLKEGDIFLDMGGG